MALYYRPRAGIIDTDPAIERLLIIAAQRRSVTDRLAQLDEHTRAIRQLSWSALQRTRPDLSPAARVRLWLAGQYGDDLADRVLAYCQAQDR